MSKPPVSIVIVSYNSRRFIEKCLLSIFGQKYPNWELIAVINGSADGSKEIIEQLTARRKKVHIIDPGKNLQFAAGNNLGISKSEGEYVLALNQDTVMEPDFLTKLVEEMEADKTLGAASGKLLHYKYDIDSKTKIIDSTGIEISKTRKVFDRGQWEQDRGQYDEDTEIFGASGAAALYRKSVLEEAKIPKSDGTFEYFDENFTAYKEDVDLAWRFQLLGYGCRYVPGAVLYHGRTVGRSWPTQFIRFILNRRSQSREVRKLSFRNHYLTMLKNETAATFGRHFFMIFVRELLLFIYTLLFEPFQAGAVADFFSFYRDTLRKRKIVQSKIKADTDKLLKLFH